MATLSQEETILLTLLLLMTGREDRLARKPLVDESQIAGIQAIWPLLRAARDTGVVDQARCDLVNRLLLSLGIMTTSPEFYCTVFQNADFSDLDQISIRVDQFRTLCMLEYGSFRFGYKQLRTGIAIEERWAKYFPSNDDATKRAKEIQDSPEPVGLIPIAASQLFALGYLASEQAEKINLARKKLNAILHQAIAQSVKDYKALQALAKELGAEKPIALIAQAGIPNAEKLMDLPLFRGSESYAETLSLLQKSCIAVDEKAIEATQLAGLQNARTYMAMHDLDIYVATSMREPLNFTTNWAFVQRLFHEGPLAAWHLRYFDPTQAFLPDRIQKGLMECLMIKRARLTVYNAQESDTFGKDSEAGVTLAQAKPVVVFVARLFDHQSNLQGVYAAVDEAARTQRDDFVKLLQERKLVTGDDAQTLLGPEKSKGDSIEFLIRKHVPTLLEALGEDQVGMELIRQGYDPESTSNEILPFAVDRILKLERRALTFRDVHPLALQTSPIDGVARGVIVTRTVEDTAKVVRGLLLGTLKYQIVEEEANWLLVDEVTRSPVRVVTKDAVLTSAFWSEQWGLK